MATALTVVNAYLDFGTTSGTGRDKWLAPGTGMEPNSAKSTGGYASFSAG